MSDASASYRIPKKILFIAFVLAIAGLAAVLYGVKLLYDGTNSSLETTSESKAIDHQYDIAVDVGGAVQRPGVYKLRALSRLSEAIDAAGGLTPEADAGHVAKQLNGASILADGQKIYVPTLLEAIATESTHNSQIQASSGGDVTSLIPINTASQAKLETLPGIGEKRAADLIELRPYQSLDELKEKGGLSDSIIEDIRDLIIF